MTFLSRYAWLAVAVLAVAGGCASDGHFDCLGYTTRPPFDPSIKTVYVPIFQNETFERGLEFEMTKALIREIESKSPLKVVSTCSEADTELTAKIVSRRKGVNNMNQLNEVRDVEMNILVEVTWKDLRSGKVLSAPDGMMRLNPDAPVRPVVITPSANYVPELGGSTASAYDTLAKRTARQIVHMMETWTVTR